MVDGWWLMVHSKSIINYKQVKMTLEITDNAAKRIGFLLSKEAENAKLRVSVDGGGCSGFQYKFEFDVNQADSDLAIKKNDVTVLIDDVSIDLLKNSVLDYVETLGASHFEIKNPQASSSCGCGNSFSV